MVSLVLNRRLNYRNIQLTSDTKNQHVGYDAGDGEAKYVRWLGFIERHEARRLAGARPVRLVCISRVGFSDVAPGEAVHGCLTAEGAYAVYDARVEFVTAERDEKRRTFTHAMCRSTLAPLCTDGYSRSIDHYEIREPMTEQAVGEFGLRKTQPSRRADVEIIVMSRYSPHSVGSSTSSFRALVAESRNLGLRAFYRHFWMLRLRAA